MQGPKYGMALKWLRVTQVTKGPRRDWPSNMAGRKTQVLMQTRTTLGFMSTSGALRWTVVEKCCREVL